MTDEQKASARARLEAGRLAYLAKVKSGEIVRKPRKRPKNSDPMVKPLLVDVGCAGRNVKAAPTRVGKQRMAVVAALYHAGFSYRDIEAQTGMSQAVIRRDVALADKHFHLSDRLAHVVTRLDCEAVPAAVDNLIADLNETREERMGARDTATYRTLEGRGLFRTYGQPETGGAGAARPAMAVQVNFTTPPGLMIAPQQAQIVGTALGSETLEAEPKPAERRESPVPVPARPIPSDYAD